MQVQVAMKKVDGVYQAILLVGRKFQRAKEDKSPSTLLQALLGPILTVEHEDGSEIAIDVAIVNMDEIARSQAREQRNREVAEANAAADELERLNKARARERSAQEEFNGHSA